MRAIRKRSRIFSSAIALFDNIKLVSSQAFQPWRQGMLPWQILSMTAWQPYVADRRHATRLQHESDHRLCRQRKLRRRLCRGHDRPAQGRTHPRQSPDQRRQPSSSIPARSVVTVQLPEKACCFAKLPQDHHPPPTVRPSHLDHRPASTGQGARRERFDGDHLRRSAMGSTACWACRSSPDLTSASASETALQARKPAASDAASAN